MVATFDVMLSTGGSDNNPGANTAITNLRFRADDANTLDTTNPVKIATGLTKYSYWRQIYLKCTAAPVTKCDNFKFYTDGGGPGTGITVNVGDAFPVHNSGATTGYDVADGTPGDTGVSMASGGHTDITTVTNLFTKTSVSPVTGPTISESGSLINSMNETTNYVVLQESVIDTASPGTWSIETLTFQYDEI